MRTWSPSCGWIRSLSARASRFPSSLLDGAIPTLPPPTPIAGLSSKPRFSSGPRPEPRPPTSAKVPATQRRALQARPATRRTARHPLGERLARAFRVAALAPRLDPSQVHRIGRPAHIPRPGQHRFMDPAGDHAAIRARRRSRVIGDRPYFQRAARPGLHVGDPQAFRPEQRRRRILEHDTCGFLVILKSVAGPESAGAAGSRSRRHARNLAGHVNRARPPITLSNAGELALSHQPAGARVRIRSGMSAMFRFPGQWPREGRTISRCLSGRAGG
jgi:hypothetical protein